MDEQQAMEAAAEPVESQSDTGGPTTIEMPRYVCHKVVSALKIGQVDLDNDGGGMLTPVEAAYAPFRVSAAFLARHEPQPGGYYVLYKDGYESYSPGQAFEEGYTRQC